MHDLQDGRAATRIHGSVYVVKPKMHGPEEVAFADEIFTRVEDVLGLPRNTVKIGIMDEERRTSRQPQGMHPRRESTAWPSSTPAFSTAPATRSTPRWRQARSAARISSSARAGSRAYENQNVDIGLECGLSGKAQIGKGMWAMPDMMAAMLEQKIETSQGGRQLRLGAQPHGGDAACAALPQGRCLRGAGRVWQRAGGAAMWTRVLDIPLATYQQMDRQRRSCREVENNAQGILGYVVRWIDQGVGCSKVPDINDVGLMEDRATCRISAQHIANWLHHGVVDRRSGDDAMQKMAAVVDRQNAGDPAYRPMAPGFRRDRLPGGLRSGVQGARAALRLYRAGAASRRRLELKAAHLSANRGVA